MRFKKILAAIMSGVLTLGMLPMSRSSDDGGKN